MISTAARRQAMALIAIACFGGDVDASPLLATMPKNACPYLVLPMRFEVAGDVRFAELSDDLWYCEVDSKQLVRRADSNEAQPAIALHIEVVPHPTGYTPTSAAREHLGDYRLHTVMCGFYGLPSEYAISNDWTLPGSTFPWRCRSATATAEAEESAGDEDLYCVFVNDEWQVLMHASLKHEALAQRGALLAAMAAIHRSGDPVVPPPPGPQRKHE